jgi:hypothetical protein
MTPPLEGCLALSGLNEGTEEFNNIPREVLAFRVY